MSQKITLLFFLLFSFINIEAQEHFPGGVAGAEAWLIIHHDNLGQQHRNYGYEHIKIIECENNLGDKKLFNFNHSFYAERLCFIYTASLENSTTRNVFFVGEPRVFEDEELSHITTQWNKDVENMFLQNSFETEEAVRNRFDISTKSSYVNDQYVEYVGISNANVNFYHWNIYQTDRKFKSYGYNGETDFYVGKKFENDETVAGDFTGNFPEFISFPFELTANQRHRVESYLALKYGITLNIGQSYLNSKNIVFWNSFNNNLFPNRIFGIGRDNISGLNQLESESVHQKDYLIASVGPLEEDNLIKQSLESIENNHFVVFGDNGQPDGLQEENDFNVRPLRRIWLSQNTGGNADEIPIFFKLNIDGVIKNELTANPDLKLWMLHDKYATNQEQSDFNSHYVDYYEVAYIENMEYGYFKETFFDPDNSVYDQFTFGVGPEMIVQIRLEAENCDEERIRGQVVITGGRAPYDIKLTNTNGYLELFTINDNILYFEALAPDTYTAYVMDSNGNEAEVSVDVIQYSIDVDLGPDQILNANLQEVTLNAGLNVTDPNATYQWYLSGDLIDHTDPILIVDSPGKYSVIVTSGNKACEAEGMVLISYNFEGSIQPNHINCEDEYGSVVVNSSGGTPPFTTVLSSSGQTILQVHNAENYTLTDIPFGIWDITTTDANGYIIQGTVELEDPFGGGLDTTILSQVYSECIEIIENPYSLLFVCEDTVFIDASIGVNSPYADYEWFENGVQMPISGPYVIIESDQGYPTTYNEYTVRVVNITTDCNITKTFWLTKKCIIRSAYDNPTYRVQATEEIIAKESEPEITSIATKIYPNPSDTNSTFYYEVTSSEVLDGTVEIFSTTGALLHQVPISGQSNYNLPFNLLSSGAYFITIRANGQVITDKLIIK